jgi:hypothetical protein
MAKNAVICKFCRRVLRSTTNYARWPELGVWSNFYPILQADRKGALGFICSKCLDSANQMREQIEKDRGVAITDHAVDQYLARIDEKVAREKVKPIIFRLYSQSRRVRFEDKFVAKRMLNNDCKDAIYMFYEPEKIMLVLNIDAPVIMTVYHPFDYKLDKHFWHID